MCLLPDNSARKHQYRCLLSDIWNHVASVVESYKELVETGLPPLFERFLSFAAEVAIAALPTPSVEHVLKVVDRTAVDTEGLTKKAHVLVETVYFGPRRSEQVRGYIINAKKRRDELHDVFENGWRPESATSRRYLPSQCQTRPCLDARLRIRIALRRSWNMQLWQEHHGLGEGHENVLPDFMCTLSRPPSKHLSQLMCTRTKRWTNCVRSQNFKSQLNINFNRTLSNRVGAITKKWIFALGYIFQTVSIVRASHNLNGTL